MKPQLAVIRGCVIDTYANGMIVEIIERVQSGADWYAPDGFAHIARGDTFALRSLGGVFRNETEFGKNLGTSVFALFDQRKVFPINDNPGNEAWVTEARKKLKPTEITERGEVRA